jgi:hypothetical protein
MRNCLRGKVVLVLLLAAGVQACVTVDDSSTVRNKERLSCPVDASRDGVADVDVARLPIDALDAGVCPTYVMNPQSGFILQAQDGGVSVSIPANALSSTTGTPITSVRACLIPYGTETQMPGYGPSGVLGTDGVTTWSLTTLGAVGIQIAAPLNADICIVPGTRISIVIPMPTGRFCAAQFALAQPSAFAIWVFDPTLGNRGMWVQRNDVDPLFSLEGGSAFQITIPISPDAGTVRDSGALDVPPVRDSGALDVPPVRDSGALDVPPACLPWPSIIFINADIKTPDGGIPCRD